MSPEEYAQLVGAFKALGGITGVALIIGILWKQFLSEAAANKKKVAAALEARVLHLEKRVEGMSEAYRSDLAQLSNSVAVLQDRSNRGGLGSDGPTVMNYPSPVLRRRPTRELPAAQVEHLDEEEKT